jgi:hypothetical protein
MSSLNNPGYLGRQFIRMGELHQMLPKYLTDVSHWLPHTITTHMPTVKALEKKQKVQEEELPEGWLFLVDVSYLGN